MAIMIGARLANAIMREATQQLDPARRQLAYNYHLVPESILSAPGR
jgi:hypothetical protein